MANVDIRKEAGILVCELKNELSPNPALASAGFEFLNLARSSSGWF